MPNTGLSSNVSPTRSQTPLWIIAVLLAFIGGLLWNRAGDPLLPAALAQQNTAAGARGVYAFTGPIDENRYGLFMMDIEQGTIWCYEMEGSGSKRQLKLTAARTWVYDRYLRDFNCSEPTFRQVQELVARQRGGVSPDSDASRGTDASRGVGSVKRDEGRVSPGDSGAAPEIDFSKPLDDKPDASRERKPRSDGSPGGE